MLKKIKVVDYKKDGEYQFSVVLHGKDIALELSFDDMMALRQELKLWHILHSDKIDAEYKEKPNKRV